MLKLLKPGGFWLAINVFIIQWLEKKIFWKLFQQYRSQVIIVIAVIRLPDSYIITMIIKTLWLLLYDINMMSKAHKKARTT